VFREPFRIVSAIEKVSLAGNKKKLERKVKKKGRDTNRHYLFMHSVIYLLCYNLTLVRFAPLGDQELGMLRFNRAVRTSLNLG
jgi:hypothetical protein